MGLLRLTDMQNKKGKLHNGSAQIMEISNEEDDAPKSNYQR
jgi:hypothetical protein